MQRLRTEKYYTYYTTIVFYFSWSWPVIVANYVLLNENPQTGTVPPIGQVR